MTNGPQIEAYVAIAMYGGLYGNAGPQAPALAQPRFLVTLRVIPWSVSEIPCFDC
jgi:hypothetical protein